jgi:hypothetical protein
MRRSQLPITALPAWSKLNDASFIDISVQDLGDAKGFGIATERALSSKDTFDVPTLMIIPHDLILSAEFIEEHAKVDQHFRQLLDAARGKVSLKPFISLMNTELTNQTVLERRCATVSVDANHHWVVGASTGCWCFESLD